MASIVTLLLFGWVVRVHGEDQDIEWQIRLGEAMEVIGVLVVATVGFVVLWVWAL